MIRIASVALPKSSMNLAQGDEVPQIITRRTRQRPPEFLTPSAKRLLQHNLPITEVVFSLDHLVGDREKRRRDRGAERRSLERPHGLAPGLVRGFQRFTSQKLFCPMGWGKLAISSGATAWSAGAVFGLPVVSVVSVDGLRRQKWIRPRHQRRCPS